MAGYNERRFWEPQTDDALDPKRRGVLGRPLGNRHEFHSENGRVRAERDRVSQPLERCFRCGQATVLCGCAPPR